MFRARLMAAHTSSMRANGRYVALMDWSDQDALRSILQLPLADSTRFERLEAALHDLKMNLRRLQLTAEEVFTRNITRVCIV